MTNNDELALKLKQTAQLVHDNEQISNYGKLEAWKVRFRHTASPANILALLAERDADKKRIAELESRTVNVNSAFGCDDCGGNGSVDIDHGELGVEHMECPKCAAAGIKLEVGE